MKGREWDTRKRKGILDNMKSHMSHGSGQLKKDRHDSGHNIYTWELHCWVTNFGKIVLPAVSLCCRTVLPKFVTKSVTPIYNYVYIMYIYMGVELLGYKLWQIHSAGQNRSVN